MSEWQTVAKLLRTILIMSATGSAVALFLFALKPLVKNRIPKTAQYYLWILILIALLVPFSAFVSIPMNTPTAPVVTLYAGDGRSLLTADADTGVIRLPASVEVQAAYRDNTGKSRVRIYYAPLDSTAEPRSLGGASRDTFSASDVENTTVWLIAEDHPDGFDGYVWAEATGSDDIEHTSEFLRVVYNPANQEISAAEEITIYIWKDRNVINYVLFSGYREQQSREEVYSGENIFQSLDALNTALSDYPFDYLHLHIVQMNLPDFSKNEMSNLIEQIEIPVGNYSGSIGYFDK